jgi:hypothetical protein
MGNIQLLPTVIFHGWKILSFLQFADFFIKQESAKSHFFLFLPAIQMRDMQFHKF